MTIHVAKDAPDHEPVFWSYQDSTGVTRRGTLEAVIDLYGSDMSYHMRCDNGQLHIVRGECITSMVRGVS